jgi:peroxiredoxin Q/BCP
VGVSADTPALQQRFIDKYGLTFPLLSDADHVIIDAWDVRKVLGLTAQRSTFLIGPDGLVARTWPKVKVDGHADEVTAAVRELSAG